MYTTIELVKKIIELSAKWAGDILEKQHTVLKLLKFFGLGMLKDEFESVYAHALVEYTVEANPKELGYLFAAKTVKAAYRTGLHNTDSTALGGLLEEQLQKNKKTGLLKHIYQTAADLGPEIERFNMIYEDFTLRSGSPYRLKRYNEDTAFQMKVLDDMNKKSFPFQVEQYLIRLRDDFQKDFLDENKYIHLNGETRIPKEGVTRGQMEAIHTAGAKEKREKDYKAKAYKPLDKLVYEWLEKETDNLLVIIGEYGTGKTTFLRHMAHQLADKALEKNGRGPLYFPLREFESSLDAFINNRFTKEGISDIDYPRFLERLEAGEFVLMLDGFDEMTQKIDSDEKQRNFDKLRAVLDKCPNGKIILTTREEYFKSDDDFHKVFRTDCQYCFAHLSPFDDEQIQQFLKSHTGDPDFYWKQIKKIFDLHDLAKRPVLLQLIVDHLPGLITEKGQTQSFNASDLYRSCIDDELSRKSRDLDFYIPGKYRLKILQDLAVWMFLNDVLAVDPVVMDRELNLRQYFNTQTDWEFEKRLNEFLTFTFLLREGDNRYRISHKSFRDYLTARAMTDEINNGEVTHFGKVKFTGEIQHFIREQAPAQDKLLHVVENARELPEDRQWQGTNAANILLWIAPNALKGRDLSGCRLTSVAFWEICDLTGADFRGADLSGCIVYSKTLLSARLDGARIEGVSAYLGSVGITDVAPLQELPQLKTLYLRNNQLTDVAPLRELTKLERLYLHNNQLTDVTPLRELTKLEYLTLQYNRLTDVTPLRGLTKLESLWLSNNQLTDVTPLRGLTKLVYLDLRNNPIPASQIRELREALTMCNIEF